jgi:hypothetical protein
MPNELEQKHRSYRKGRGQKTLELNQCDARQRRTKAALTAAKQRGVRHCLRRTPSPSSPPFDMPEATPFMLHIYAAVAEQEARAISARTKVASATARRRTDRAWAIRCAALPLSWTSERLKHRAEAHQAKG